MTDNVNSGDEVEFPSWYDDLAEFEHEHKGYLDGVVLRRAGKSYHVTFYDLARLRQDAEAEFAETPLWLRTNLIVIPSVTRTFIERALSALGKEDLDSLFVEGGP